MNYRRRERGVASVVGTMIFVVVFLLALGAMAYLSGAQAQSTQAQAQAESLAASKGSERLGFVGAGSSLSAQNEGGTSVDINHLILAYPNGTTFALPVSALVPAGGETGVAPLVPEGSCGPEGETCLTRYDAIVGGGSPGSSVGLLTSLGNTFWYYPSQGAGSGEQVRYTPSTLSTNSTAFAGIPGLSFSGAAGAEYVVHIEVGYYQVGGIVNEVYFSASAPSGATFLECTDVRTMFVGYQASCTQSPGAPFPQPVCYSLYPSCSFQATLFVAFGSSAGSVQLEFRSGGIEVTAYVSQGSYMLVSQVG